jgi:hypothetical protein
MFEQRLIEERRRLEIWIDFFIASQKRTNTHMIGMLLLVVEYNEHDALAMLNGRKS